MCRVVLQMNMAIVESLQRVGVVAHQQLTLR